MYLCVYLFISLEKLPATFIEKLNREHTYKSAVMLKHIVMLKHKGGQTFLCPFSDISLGSTRIQTTVLKGIQ